MRRLPGSAGRGRGSYVSSPFTSIWNSRRRMPDSTLGDRRIMIFTGSPPSYGRLHQVTPSAIMATAAKKIRTPTGSTMASSTPMPSEIRQSPAF